MIAFYAFREQASQPWKSPGLVQIPRFSLVGRVLIATAVQLSVEEGFRVRIGLHALPQAETFYARNRGMTDLGNDMRKEELRIFRDGARTGSSVPSVRHQ